MTIGITLRYERLEERDLFTLNKKFLEIFSKYKIILLPIVDVKSIKEYAKICDAVILTGSPVHINPKLYNEEPLFIYDKMYEHEDLLDYKIIDEFDKLNKPIIGICRGTQVINTYFGGTLNQKIPNHEDCYHNVNIVNDSFLNKIYQSDKILVNSSHSQSIKNVAKGFKICAISEDNCIEAIHKDNIYGVQWHPEKDYDYAFFEYFIKKILSI